MRTKKFIFIGGCPRSGTTLLGSLIGGARGCITTPESQFKSDLARKILKGELLGRNHDIKRALLANWRFKLWGINQFLEFSDARCDNNSLSDVILHCVDSYALKCKKHSWDTWVDHTPDNIKQIPFLLKYFQNSFFIHMIRDGRGVYSSVKSLDWGPNGPIGGSKWWTSHIASGMAAELAYKEKILRVRFEDLLSDPEKELEKICDFAAIRYESSLLNNNGFVVPNYTVKQHKLVGKPIDKTVCEKWKYELSSREIEIFEHISGHILEYNGYNLFFGKKATPPTRWDRFSELIILEFINKLSNLLIKKRKRRILSAISQ